jgi:hypothetical protein
MLIGILRNKLNAGDGLIECATRYTCLYRFYHTGTGRSPRSRWASAIIKFPDGTAVLCDLIAPSSRPSPWKGRVDVRQAATVRPGAERHRRISPASGRTFSSSVIFGAQRVA